MKNIFEGASRRLSELVEEKQALVSEVKNIIDNHWQFVQIEQRRIKRKIQKNDKSESPTAAAPYVRMKTGDFARHKAYIVWREWKHNPQAKSSNTQSIRTELKPYALGYTTAFFVKHCQPWLVDYAIETEKHLAPLREQLDALHEHIIKQRKIVNKLNNQVEADHG